MLCTSPSQFRRGHHGVRVCPCHHFSCSEGWFLPCPQPGVTQRDPHCCDLGLHSLQTRAELWSWGCCGTEPFPPLRARVCPRGSPALGLRGGGTWGWQEPGAVTQGWNTGLVPEAVTRGCHRGLTPLAAWAVPACAGTERGEGHSEEFAIWASLLLSCCYGTAEMLPGRRWWPVCVTPGLPGGREVSPVEKTSLFTQHHQGRTGVLMAEHPEYPPIEGVSVQLRAAFSQVRRVQGNPREGGSVWSTVGAGFGGLAGRGKGKDLAALHRQEQHLHSLLPCCPTSPWAWPGVAEPRQCWQPWGERQHSPHSCGGAGSIWRGGERAPRAAAPLPCHCRES